MSKAYRIGSLMLSGLTLLVGLSSASSQENPRFDCKISDSGKKMTILGFNSSAKKITCTQVKCEAFINVPGGKRICEIKTEFILPSGAAKQFIGDCTNDKDLATSVIGVSHSCQ